MIMIMIMIMMIMIKRKKEEECQHDLTAHANYKKNKMSAFNVNIIRNNDN